MSTTVLGALVTAGVLGVTHALEPDHVAGITSLTGEYGDSRLSALVGACFSAGHVALVVGWLVIASVLVERTTFPPVFDAVGQVGVGLTLGLLGVVMAVGGFRRVVRVDDHDHGEITHAHPHLHLPLPGFDGHEHGHGTAAYLRTGLVGALFTLSPPVSMLVFATTLLPDVGASVLTLAVATYAVAITATMSLLGAGSGALFGVVRSRGPAIHGGVRFLAGLVVAGLASAVLLDAASVLG